MDQFGSQILKNSTKSNKNLPEILTKVQPLIASEQIKPNIELQSENSSNSPPIFQS